MKCITILGVLVSVFVMTGVGQTPAVYVATSPCGNTPRPFIGIEKNEKCDRIMWELTLHNNGSSLTFALVASHGYHVDNRTYKKTGAKTITGTWSRTTDKRPIVALLAPGTKPIYFVQMDANILHLLNQDRTLMVGDGGQSYTLSRKR